MSTGSVGEALAAACDALAAAGVETPRLDAELLLAECAAADRASLAAHPDTALDPPVARRFGGMVRRRIRHEPVAYILGRKWFRRIELAVDRRVLIPRPESELLVEVALELEPATVLDVGTGSGAVALAVAEELPRARVVATDVSPGALAVARANAQRLGLADRVELEAGTLPPGGCFELVLANLPYVSEADRDSLPADVRDWEPAESLLAGPDGLGAIRDLLDRLAAGEVEAVAVALEVGIGQAPEVERLIGEAGFASTARRRDLSGIERVVVGRRGR